MLMIVALRSRGVAARFVSGYLQLAEEEHEDEYQITGGNTHAWVQVFVPGPGWVDFDPSRPCGKPEPHPRRCRGSPARRNSTTGDMVRARVGSPLKCRSE